MNELKCHIWEDQCKTLTAVQMSNFTRALTDDKCSRQMLNLRADL